MGRASYFGRLGKAKRRVIAVAMARNFNADPAGQNSCAAHNLKTELVLRRFKQKILKLTGRSWGVSMSYRLQKLAEYIRGWMGYFQLSEYYSPIPLLDQWIRRRLRCCFIKQWRKAKTKVSNLLKLGVDIIKAACIGASNKGHYRLSKTYAIQLGLNDNYLAKVGLVSLKDLWVMFHYPR